MKQRLLATKSLHVDYEFRADEQAFGEQLMAEALEIGVDLNQAEWLRPKVFLFLCNKLKNLNSPLIFCAYILDLLCMCFECMCSLKIC